LILIKFESARSCNLEPLTIVSKTGEFGLERNSPNSPHILSWPKQPTKVYQCHFFHEFLLLNQLCFPTVFLVLSPSPSSTFQTTFFFLLFWFSPAALNSSDLCDVTFSEFYHSSTSSDKFLFAINTRGEEEIKFKNNYHSIRNWMEKSGNIESDNSGVKWKSFLLYCVWKFNNENYRFAADFTEEFCSEREGFFLCILMRTFFLERKNFTEKNGF
jgi:hypothetical protein